MIYPQKIKARESNKIINLLLVISITLAIILVIINKLTIPRIRWAALANGGIVYIWITVIYSIKRNVNIAGHVLLQTIALSILTVFIDYELGFKGWSIDIAIPIMIIVANATMLILTIVSYKKYIKYAIYQLIIVFFSMLPLILITGNIIHNNVLSIIASCISIFNFIITLILSARDVKEAIIRKFHI